MQKQNSISENCSCLQCDSLSCFAKRQLFEHCTCDDCNKSCRYYTSQNQRKRSHPDKICDVYLNATPPRSINRFEELTEHNIDFESERKKVVETNQPPQSLDEYLDRLLLCVKKSSIFKQQPSSLNEYIDIISENSEYKKKLNLLKTYVQSFKNAKSPNFSEDLVKSENFKNSMCSKELCHQNSQLSEPHRKKCRGKCKSRQIQRNLNLTQAQSALVSCPQEYCPGPRRFGSQTNSVINENTNNKISFRTTASKENGIFLSDIVKKIKEAYKACSCKVCQCIPSKLNKDDECQCKPCECAECAGYIVTPIASRACVLPSEIICCTNRYCKQNKLRKLNEQKKCLYVPSACAMCIKNCSTAHCDQSKPLTSYKPSASKNQTEVPCTCLPCECLKCSQRYTGGQVFSETQFYHSNKQIAPVNEIYRHGKGNNRNIVAMYADIPRLNANIGFASTRSKSCFDKECECYNCVCKEDTINSIKSSRFFSYDNHNADRKSVMDRSSVLMKFNNSHINSHCSKIKTERVHQPSSNLVGHSPCCVCEECIRLERKVPLNRCQCSVCKCERCYAHKRVPNYSKTGGSSVKHGEVTHQTKMQNLKSEEYKLPTYKYRYNVKPQYEVDDWHTTSKYLTYQPSISRQTKRDIGTMHTKSLSKWDVLQCDAYVQSQEWTFTNPVLKNNSTNMTPGSYVSLDSMTRTQSIENYIPPFENPDYFSPFSKQGIISVEDTLKLNSTSFAISSVLKNDKTESQNNFEGIFGNNSLTHNKFKTHEGFNRANSNNQQESKVMPMKDYYMRSKIVDGSETPNKIVPQFNNSIESFYIALGLPNLRRTKCLSDSFLPSLERFKNSEEILNDKNIKSSNERDNFKCFRMIQNFNKPIFRTNVHNRYKLPKEKCLDYSTNDVLDIDEDYKRVQKTLADAKNFSMYLLSLLEMYEKANNEFEKVSEKLKLSYESLFGDKITNDQEKCDTKLESESLNTGTLHLKEAKILDLNQTISHNAEIAHEPKLEVKLSKTELDIVEKLSIVNKSEENELRQNKNLNPVSHDEIHNELSNVMPTTLSTAVERDSKFPTHDNDAMAEVSHYESVEQVPEKAKPADNIELLTQLPRSMPTEINTLSITTYVDTFKLTTKVEKEVETNDLTDSQYSFCCTAEPYSPNNSEGIIGYTYEVGTKVLSVSLNEQTSPMVSLNEQTSPTVSLNEQTSPTVSRNEQTSPTTVIQKEVSHRGNKALNQVYLEVKKLLELAILEPLNYVEDTEDSLIVSSTIVAPRSLIKLDVNAQAPSNRKPTVQPSLYVNKEVWCDGQMFLTEFKRQIREELQMACTHPLMNKGSSLGSYSSNGEFEDQKARFLVVRKVSEHTALVRWNEPRDLMGVKGYELQVDGRTIQKIFNPSKCITAVTCLPHTDKILLTIRTITLVKPDTGRYPSTTIVYRPRLQ